MLLAGLFAGGASKDLYAREPVQDQVIVASRSAGVQTVSQVVEHTINSNPEVQAKWHEFMAAYHEEAIPYGGYFPKVDVSAGIGREWVGGTRSMTMSIPGGVCGCR